MKPSENAEERSLDRKEVCKNYLIPERILEEYHAWGLCDAVKDVVTAWQYSDTDIERLSMIMALHDIGFDQDEVRQYMLLVLAGCDTETERAGMLETLRKRQLKEIHLREAQLDRLDYLRHEIELHQDGTNSV
jgi:DNA-binding transcriptional MerR regulator